MKIAVIGGASSYTPELVEGLVQAALPLEEVWLCDLSGAEERLAAVTRLAERMARRASRDVRFVATFVRRDAVREADFVLHQFRQGGLRMRALDERLPLRHGVIGQETTGPGGFANALRTIPVVLEIAREVEELAPKAWLLNFTNPAGLVTQALVDEGHERAIGLCNIPRITARRIALAAGTSLDAVRLDVLGLNHLTATRIALHGEDRTAQALQSGAMEEELRKVAPDTDPPEGFFPGLGFVPNPYLNYFFFPRETLQHALREALSPEGTRAERVQAIERRLFSRYRDESLAEKPPELAERGGAYYSEVAVDAMVALCGEEPRELVLNVQNRGAIGELGWDDVVERNALVDRDGVRAVPAGSSMPRALAALVHPVKEYERLTVEAIRERSRRKAHLALLAHPLVPGAAAAEGLLQDLGAANREYWPTLR